MFLTRKLASTLARKVRTMATLETLNFDNRVLRTLPIDSVVENYTREVPGACFSKVKPDTVSNPRLVSYSKSAMALLDIGEQEIQRPEVVEYFSGNKLLPGSETAAHCYCGHQFGYFSGQLGDGAAMYLGEVVNSAGERWEIQLKGVGKTPYSRNADGRKVLRSTLREFLCSEAIHHLGIPTTRAGTCVTSDSTIVRDIFYDGNAIDEQCSVVLRIAPTFFRFGSFEIFKPESAETGRKGPSVGREDILRQMLDYSIQTFYKEIWDAHCGDREKMYFEFWKEVVQRTAVTVAEWQSVGFCHGVLNTDNMSIMGLTIDYGPFGFMDRYQGDFVCNGSDDGGRYSFQKQPEICKWNCKKLAEAIQMVLPLVHTEPNLQRIFDSAYSSHYTQKVRRKLGLLKIEHPEDKELVKSFLTTMEKSGADFTNSFRCLSRLPLPSAPDFNERLTEVKEYLLSQCCTADELKKSYAPRMEPRQLQMFLQLMQTNPAILGALGGRFAAIATELDRLEKLDELKSLTNEKKREADSDLWDVWLSRYTDRLKLEEEATQSWDTANTERISVMNGTNPRFVLRNYIAQNAISAAENGDFSEVQRVMRLIENPYSESVDLSDIPRSQSSVVQDADAGAAGGDVSHCVTHAELCYDGKPPDWALGLRVT